MRDGNTVDMAGATKRVPLLDLPMRDGNQDRLWVVRGSDPPFRPSYEGWKLPIPSQTP